MRQPYAANERLRTTLPGPQGKSDGLPGKNELRDDGEVVVQPTAVFPGTLGRGGRKEGDPRSHERRRRRRKRRRGEGAGSGGMESRAIRHMRQGSGGVFEEMRQGVGSDGRAVWIRPRAMKPPIERKKDFLLDIRPGWGRSFGGGGVGGGTVLYFKTSSPSLSLSLFFSIFFFLFGGGGGVLVFVPPESMIRT